MIYQFEHDEIKDCFGCPIVDGEYGDCNITGTEGSMNARPPVCPLVAISKTETTSCEWCEIASACEYEVTFFKAVGFELGYDRCATKRSLMPHYCPNCGRKLKENENEA